MNRLPRALERRGWRNSREHYGLVSQIFHWAIAALILVTTALGLYAASFEDTDMTRMPWIETHRSFGLVVLTLTAARLLWLVHSPGPDLAAGLSNWERRAAWVGHKILYLLLLAIPTTGFMVSQTAGREISVFGLFTIPQIVPIDPSVPVRERPFMDLWVLLHKEVLDIVLYAAVSVHLLAVIKHHYFDRDPAILQRMWGR
jgi:cytochrome b561